MSAPSQPTATGCRPDPSEARRPRRVTASARLTVVLALATSCGDDTTRTKKSETGEPVETERCLEAVAPALDVTQSVKAAVGDGEDADLSALFADGEEPVVDSNVKHQILTWCTEEASTALQATNDLLIEASNTHAEECAATPACQEPARSNVLEQLRKAIQAGDDFERTVNRRSTSSEEEALHPGTLNLAGRLLLNGEVEFGGPQRRAPCTGAGDYADIGASTQVLVTDAEGTKLALAALGKGRRITDACEFYFLIPSVPADAPGVLTVSLGDRGSTDFSIDLYLQNPTQLWFSLG